MATDELEEVKTILAQHDKRIADLENIAKNEPQKIQKQQSIKEFILEKKPDDDVQKTLVIGYYLEHNRSMSSFNADDIEDLFREAKESVPGNINDTVNKNIKKGLMMEAQNKKGNRKSWMLTADGERLVENGFKQQ